MYNCGTTAIRVGGERSIPRKLIWFTCDWTLCESCGITANQKRTKLSSKLFSILILYSKLKLRKKRIKIFC